MAPTKVGIESDKPIHPSITNGLRDQKIEFGEYVRAGDRFEVLKPPYAVVKQQDNTARGKLNVVGAELVDKRVLVLTTDPHPQAVTYELAIPKVRALGEPDSAGWMADIDYDFTDPLWVREAAQHKAGWTAGLKWRRSEPL